MEEQAGNAQVSEAKPQGTVGNVSTVEISVANLQDVDSKEIGDLFDHFGTVIDVQVKRKHQTAFPMEDLPAGVAVSVKRLCTEKSKSAINVPDEKVENSSLELITAVMLQRKIVENIFSFLDISKQIQLERVCLQWRIIGRNSFWRRLKKLDLRPYIRDRSANSTTDDVVEGILSRCGKHLRQITFTDTRINESIYDYLNSILRSLHLISQSCPNLVKLECYRASITNEALLLLAEDCPNLETLILESSTSFDFKGLTTFVTLCKTLRSLQVSAIDETYSDYFSVCINQHNNLRFLRIYPEAIDLTTEAIEILFNRLYDLEEIHLPNCFSVSKESLCKLFSKCGTKIKELYFERLPLISGINRVWQESLPILSNLVRLSLRCMDVDDTICSILANNCKKLEHVDIIRSEVTDSGLFHLANLQDLKTLDISRSRNITSIGIVKIAKRGKLEKLFLAECNLQEADVGCCSLASFCPNFNFLDATNLHISDLVVSDFVKAIKSGFMNGPVRILVYRTDIHQSVEKCEKLQLEFVPQY